MIQDLLNIALSYKIFINRKTSINRKTGKSETILRQMFIDCKCEGLLMRSFQGVLRICEYKNGRRQGIKKDFQKGRLVAKYKYEDGMRRKKWEYDENGELTQMKFYDKDALFLFREVLVNDGSYIDEEVECDDEDADYNLFPDAQGTSGEGYYTKKYQNLRKRAPNNL